MLHRLAVICQKKASFWSEFEIPSNELVVIRAEINGHVSETNVGFEGCHVGFDYCTTYYEREGWNLPNLTG